MNKVKIIIIAVVAVAVLALIPDTVHNVSKAKKEKDAEKATEEVSVSSEETTAELASTTTETETAEAASTVVTSEENSPEYYKDLDINVNNGAGSFFTDGDENFLFLLEDNGYVTDFSHASISFKDSGIERFEHAGTDRYLITSEEKTYYIDSFSDNGFVEMPAEAVNPSLSEAGFSYIIPANGDMATGELYDTYCVNQSEPKLIASDVVTASNFFSVVTEDDNIAWYYSKNINGEYSLVKATAGMDEFKNGDEYKVTEEVLKEGEYQLLYVYYGDKYYYYNPASQELFYYSDGEDKLIYTGTYDNYYVDDSNNIMFTDGDNLYYYADQKLQEAAKVTAEGVASLTCRGGITDCGHLNGHYIDAGIGNTIITDKLGNEYYISEAGSEGVKTVNLTHKIEEDKVKVYPDGNRGRVLYITDGIMYMDIVGPNDSSQTYIVFDKEKVADYLVVDYANNVFMIIFTEEGNLYLENAYDNSETLIDTGVDYNSDKTGANMAYDYEWSTVVYSKDGKIYSSAVGRDSKDEILESQTGFFLREKDMALDFIFYFVPTGSDTKKFFYGESLMEIK